MTFTDVDWAILIEIKTFIEDWDPSQEDPVIEIDRILLKSIRNSEKFSVKGPLSNSEKDFLGDCLGCFSFLAYAPRGDESSDEPFSIDITRYLGSVGRTLRRLIESALSQAFLPTNFPVSRLEYRSLHDPLEGTHFIVKFERYAENLNSYKQAAKILVNALKEASSKHENANYGTSILHKIEHEFPHFQNFRSRISFISADRQTIQETTRIAQAIQTSHIVLIGFNESHIDPKLLINGSIQDLTTQNFRSSYDAIFILNIILRKIAGNENELCSDDVPSKYKYQEDNLSQVVSRLRGGLRRLGLEGFELQNLNKKKGTQTRYRIRCPYPILWVT